MMVYDVIRKVEKGSYSSYKAGTEWMESHDDETHAAQAAERYNYHVATSCRGVTYEVAGPFEETAERVYD